MKMNGLGVTLPEIVSGQSNLMTMSLGKTLMMQLMMLQNVRLIFVTE